MILILSIGFPLKFYDKKNQIRNKNTKQKKNTELSVSQKQKHFAIKTHLHIQFDVLQNIININK